MNGRNTLILAVIAVAGCTDVSQRDNIDFEAKFVEAIGLSAVVSQRLSFYVHCTNRFGGFLCVGSIEGSVRDVSTLLNEFRQRAGEREHVEGDREINEYLRSLARKVDEKAVLSVLKAPIKQYDVAGPNGTLTLFADPDGSRVIVVWIGEKS